MPHTWQVLTPIERLFVEGSDPSNQMNVTIVFSLSQNVTRAWLDTPIARMLAHPRFRSRIAFARGAAPAFAEVPGFKVGSPSLDSHVFVEPAAPDGLDHAERCARFMSRLSDIASDHLPLSVPLWRIFLFPGFSIARPDALSDADVSTLVVKVHHAVADGLGLLKFFLNRVLDPCDGAEEAAAATPSAVPRRQIGAERGVEKASRDERTRAARKNTLITSPPQTGVLARALGYLRDLFVTPIALLIPDRPSALNAVPCTGRKLCAMLPASRLPLLMLRDAARAHGVTINDLLYAAVCASFERVLRARGVTDPGALEARVIVPFGHAANGYDDTALCNSFAFLLQPLHLGTGLAKSGALTRLRLCADAMRDAKEGLRPAVSLFLTRVLALLPHAPKLAVWRRLTHSCAQAFSNVPGPRGKVCVGEVAFESVHFFVPQEGDLRVGVAVLSYDGGLGVTVQADEARLEDPARFLEVLEEEVMCLVALAKGTSRA